MKSQVGKAPGLAVIVAGSQRSSMLYVQNKTIACEEVGISSACEKLPEDVSEEQILATIRKYNEDPSTHGILVQLPLPKVNAHTDNSNSVQLYAAKYGHPLFACSTCFFIGSLLFLVISNTSNLYASCSLTEVSKESSDSMFDEVSGIPIISQ